MDPIDQINGKIRSLRNGREIADLSESEKAIFHDLVRERAELRRQQSSSARKFRCAALHVSSQLGWGTLMLLMLGVAAKLLGHGSSALLRRF